MENLLFQDIERISMEYQIDNIWELDLEQFICLLRQLGAID